MRRRRQTSSQSVNKLIHRIFFKIDKENPLCIQSEKSDQDNCMVSEYSRKTHCCYKTLRGGHKVRRTDKTPQPLREVDRDNPQNKYNETI